MEKFKILREHDGNFRKLISSKPLDNVTQKEFKSLFDRFDITDSNLNSINDLIFLGFDYDDEYEIPEYQRELKWTLLQKQRFIKSVLVGNPIGDFLFKEVKVKTSINDIKFVYRVIDGQQRLNALREFATGEIPLEDGRFLKEILYWDARSFFNYTSFNALKVKNITLKEEIELYLQKNEGGTVHTEEELDKARLLLNNL